jgi:triosephosphate isomerase
MIRNKIVAGNWKMNKTLNEGIEFIHVLKQGIPALNHTKVIVGMPFIHLASAGSDLNGKFSIAAQNCHHEAQGAFTGEISASMIQSTGAEYVILGHSERRQYFKETDELILKKVKAALDQGLTPIFCCGEPLDVREDDAHVAYVNEQLENSIFQLSNEEILKIIIAYEPIWAIGTGKTASSAQAQEMHKEIRISLADNFTLAIANNVPILYGGSCSPSNAEELFSQEDVDGGLIGGASLKTSDFLELIRIAESIN